MPQPAFEVSFDKKSRTAYLRFSREKVAETVEFADGSLLIDLDHVGGLVGIEVLSAGTLRLLLQPQPNVNTPVMIPPLDASEVEKIEHMLAAM
jgi:uncharacterized protein YuzE